jgi:GNAT superfamily N-acetyltransferase
MKAKDGLSVQCEPLADLLRDGQALMREHTAEVGEHPENFANKNYDLMQRLEDIGALQVVVARSNGRVFGYLVTVIGPSMEVPGQRSACATAFYASPDYPGLGMKMQRESVRLLKEMGVSEIALRAGVRGSGQRIGALYRRLGAEPFGDLYRLEL